MARNVSQNRAHLLDMSTREDSCDLKIEIERSQVSKIWVRLHL